MKVTELRQKQQEFMLKLPELNRQLAQSIDDRKKFITRFNIQSILNLQKDDYVHGKHTEGNESFCYFLETKLYELGRIGGTNTLQYGVYYGNYKKDKTGKKQYRFSKRYGNSFDEAFNRVKNEIHKLLLAGKNNDYNAIADCMIAAKFKGKILSTYFPLKYLSIFSDEYLYDVLVYFNLDGNGIIQMEPIYKQQHLIEFKNSDPIMKKWSLDEFAMFINNELYTHLYQPKKNKQTALPHAVPEFEDIDFVNPEYVEEELIEAEIVLPSFNGTIGKGDYDGKSRKDKAIGDRGEIITLKAERNRLAVIHKRPELAKKVKWVSEKDDSKGYDILSFDIDENGSYYEKYIEVKSTMNFINKKAFFLSGNELAKAKSLKNYHIYFVYNLSERVPKIWDIGNPFHPIDTRVKLLPIMYKVFIAK